MRSGSGVAGVLHDRREGSLGQRGGSGGQADGRGDGHPISHRHVVQTGMERLAGVEGGVDRRVVTGGEDGERRRCGRGRRILEGVARARGEVPDDQGTLGVGEGSGDVVDRGSVLQKVDLVARGGTGHPGLVDGTTDGERHCRRTSSGGDHRHPRGDDDGTDGDSYSTRQRVAQLRHGFPPWSGRSWPTWRG